MLPVRLLGKSAVMRELAPQDLKLDVDQFGREEAVRAAHYLADRARAPATTRSAGSEGIATPGAVGAAGSIASLRHLVLALNGRSDEAEIRLIDAAYWMKGCSSQFAPERNGRLYALQALPREVLPVTPEGAAANRAHGVRFGGLPVRLVPDA
jgi:hypothetical protein